MEPAIVYSVQTSEGDLVAEVYPWRDSINAHAVRLRSLDPKMIVGLKIMPTLDEAKAYADRCVR